MLLIALAAAAALAGPGIRARPAVAGTPALIETYDSRGRTVRLLHCSYRAPLAGTDPLPGLVRNRAFMAILAERDGAIEPWDLEPAWPSCEFRPPDGSAPESLPK